MGFSIEDGKVALERLFSEGRLTVIIEICYLAFKVWALSNNVIDPDARSPLDTERKLASTSAVNTDDLGGNTKIVQVALLGRAWIDDLDGRGVDFLAITDQELTVGADKWRANWNARNGDAIDAAIRALGGSSLVDMCEKGGDIGAARSDRDSLYQTWQQDCIPRQRYQGEVHLVRLAHGGGFGAVCRVAGSVKSKPAGNECALPENQLERQRMWLYRTVMLRYKLVERLTSDGVPSAVRCLLVDGTGDTVPKQPSVNG